MFENIYNLIYKARGWNPVFLKFNYFLFDIFLLFLCIYIKNYF